MICDVQREYAECLLRILSERLSGKYQFHLFTDAERMLEFTGQSGFSVLLVSEEYREYAEQAGNGQKYVLTELPCVRVNGNGEPVPVFRYQPAERIIKELCGGSEAAPAKKVRTHAVKPPEERTDPRGLIGIYSPVHRVGKTQFALRLGQRLAEDIPVLYLSMEGYSGRELYFPGNEGENLGDLLYCMRQERSDHGLRISSMTGRLGRMDYIRPMENVMDLRAVRAEEWQRLFGLIAEKCAYEAVILDLGDGIDGLYGILEQCSRIYTPYISSPVSLAKLKQYEDNLRESGHENILRHTVKKLMRKKSGTPERDGG